jgi:thioredoxin 1
MENIKEWDGNLPKFEGENLKLIIVVYVLLEILLFRVGLESQSMNRDDGDEEIQAIKQRKLLEMRNSAMIRYDMNSKIRPVVLTDINFRDEVSKYPLMLIDFWAPWCGPCRMISPIIEELASKYRGKVVFGKLNIDESQTVAQNFGIQSIPTMIILRNAKVVDVIIGALPKVQIESRIMQHLSESDNTVGNVYG